MKQLRKKLVTENATLVQADKGKTTVIITLEAYSDKVHTFLAANNFPVLTKDPTNTCHLHKKTLQHCNLIIGKHKIKYLIQKKPSPPTLKAQLKLHKPDIPIRLVINNRNAPTYKLAKYLVQLLNTHLTLKNYYNVINSTNLATDLTQLKIGKNHKLITYDIKYLFVNIPIEETLVITKSY
jgi:hypothetical protein